MSHTIEEPLRAVNGYIASGRSAEENFGEMRRRLAHADAFARKMARERPLLAAGLALTAGFVVGRLVARHG